MGIFNLFNKKKSINWNLPSKASYDAKVTATEKYYNGMKEVEKRWSILYNLNDFYSKRTDEFESLCHRNIEDYHIMLAAEKACGEDPTIPIRVPAYVRLAMLYEKKEDYENALLICATAIKEGASLDGNRGQMQGRLARLIKKYGGSVNSSITDLLDL